MQTFDQSKELFRSMLRLRYFEEKVREEYKNGLMRTPIHLGIGQEAVAVGVIAARKLNDPVLTHHRSHNAYLACQGDMRALFSELQGKLNGCSGGKGGSVHIIDRNVNFFGSSAILSQIIAIATGVAYANDFHKKKNVTIVFFGDAGFEEGTAWESFNFASIHKLPILFVCENNFYSTESPLKSRMASGTNFIEKMESFGVKAEQVDGNDVIRVFEKASELINLARIQGPQLMECLTYRHFEHVGPFTDAEQSRNYRSEAEVNTWIKKCPIARIEKLLVEEGKISNLEINKIKSATYEEILINWQKSCDDAYPKINSLHRNLFASS